MNRKEFLHVSGNISVFSNFKSEFTATKFNSSFNSTVNASLLINLLDIQFPFSLSYTDNSLSQQKPANLMSLHPSYRWLKLHLGRFSPLLSSYTLSGKPISGYGLEINPKKNQFALYFGKLEPLKTNQIQPSEKLTYERNCLAISSKLNFSRLNLSLIYFLAADKTNHKDSYRLYKLILPEKNEVVSVSFRLKITSKLILDADGSASAYEKNALINKQNAITSFMFSKKNRNNYSFLFSCLKLNLSYSSEKNNSSLTIERVSPGYTSMGVFPQANDRIQGTIKTQHSFLDKRLSLTFLSALQTNNLNKLKTETALNSNLNLGFAFYEPRRITLACNYIYVQSSSIGNENQTQGLVNDLFSSGQSQQIFTCMSVFKVKKSKKDLTLNYSRASSSFKSASQINSSIISAIQSSFTLFSKKTKKSAFILNYSETNNEKGKVKKLGAGFTFTYFPKKTTQLNISLAAKSSLNNESMLEHSCIRVDFQKKFHSGKADKERLNLHLTISDEIYFSVFRRSFFIAQAQLNYVI